MALALFGVELYFSEVRKPCSPVVADVRRLYEVMLFKKKPKTMPLQVIGVHKYQANEATFQKTLILQWGEELEGAELDEAKRHVTEHFDNLFLIEILSQQPLQPSDWASITQEEKGVSKENWQVPYDERHLDDSGCRWVFFFHFLNPNKPLKTIYGNIELPKPTPLPIHLKNLEYEAPG